MEDEGSGEEEVRSQNSEFRIQKSEGRREK